MVLKDKMALIKNMLHEQTEPRQLNFSSDVPSYKNVRIAIDIKTFEYIYLLTKRYLLKLRIRKIKIFECDPMKE